MTSVYKNMHYRQEQSLFGQQFELGNEYLTISAFSSILFACCFAYLDSTLIVYVLINVVSYTTQVLGIDLVYIVPEAIIAE